MALIRAQLTGTLLVGVIGSWGCGAPPPGCPGDVRGPQLGTTLGCVVGRTEADVEAFLGVPYAEPPIGALRWRRTVPAQPWGEPLQAVSAGPQCVQSEASEDGLDPGDGDEDCLTLNVLRPAGTQPGDALPLVFFVHGGGQVDGSASRINYLGPSLAPSVEVPQVEAVPSLARRAVVVLPQYRLGPFGWLAHPELIEEDEAGSTGNQGLWDVRMALRWASDNAEALGADPQRIVLAGHSGGGAVVCALLTSPGLEGLYGSAVIQSSPCTSAEPTLTEPGFGRRAGLEVGETVALALGCADAPDVPGCMRSRSTHEIIDALELHHDPFLVDEAAYGPMIDGVVVPVASEEAFASGDVPDVPVILGIAEDDGSLLVSETIEDRASLEARLEAQASLLGLEAQVLLGRYTPEAFGTPTEALRAFYTDLFFVCPVRSAALSLGAHREVRTYWFARDSFLEPQRGAFHGVELPYLFGSYPLPPTDDVLSWDVQSAWLSSPEAPTLPGLGPWPTADTLGAQRVTWLHLDVPARLEVERRREACAALDRRWASP